MNKLKKLVCTACAALCCFGASEKVLAEKYSLQLSYYHHYIYRRENDEGIGLALTKDGRDIYVINIIENSDVSSKYSRDLVSEVCNTLYLSCKKQGFFAIEKNISKDCYYEFLKPFKLATLRKSTIEDRSKSLEDIISKILHENYFFS